MRTTRPKLVLVGFLALHTLCALAGAASGEFKVLYTFTGGADGDGPLAGLVLDNLGNGYGTTCEGGAFRNGVAYEISPASGRKWTETVLYNFGSGSDGQCPESALTFDFSGNLYGTTSIGGSYGAGTVFELSHTPMGWAETVLHNFGDSQFDGTYPSAGVTFDSTGNIYGTTNRGGYYGSGTVYVLTPSGGSATERVIYDFRPHTTSEASSSGVAFDSFGNLYGTTATGGSYGCGNVFMLTKSGSHWIWSSIHDFRCFPFGDTPYSTPAFDSLGNLYGTTFYGGATNAGTVFRLSPQGGGWNFALLHSFTGSDGANPTVGVSTSASGNTVYGTTSSGNGVWGTVYYLAPDIGRKWTEHVSHSFHNGPDEGYPNCLPVVDANGNIYGTAWVPQTTHGVVFEVLNN